MIEKKDEAAARAPIERVEVTERMYQAWESYLPFTPSDVIAKVYRAMRDAAPCEHVWHPMGVGGGGYTSHADGSVTITVTPDIHHCYKCGKTKQDTGFSTTTGGGPARANPKAITVTK